MPDSHGIHLSTRLNPCRASGNKDVYTMYKEREKTMFFLYLFVVRPASQVGILSVSPELMPKAGNTRALRTGVSRPLDPT